MIDTHAVNIVRRDGHGDVFEWLAILSGEDYRAIPTSICPVVVNVVAHYGGMIADDDFRTSEMTRLLPRLLNTRSTPEVEERRWWTVLDWHTRFYLPLLFQSCGLYTKAYDFATLHAYDFTRLHILGGHAYYTFDDPHVGVATAARRCLTNAAAVHGSARGLDEALALAPQCLATVRHYLTGTTPAETQAIYASVASLLDRVLT